MHADLKTHKKAVLVPINNASTSKWFYGCRQRALRCQPLN
jgi:hypothetical protein